MNTPEILCLFYSDITVHRFLNVSAGRDLAGDLLVEVATSPNLSFALGLETPANHPGIAGIAGQMSLTDLAVENSALPVPIILAAGSPVGISALRCALANLTSKSDGRSKITLLVPITDAALVGAGLGIADTFAVAWDATALPSSDLVRFAEWLNEEELLEAEQFAGLHPYTPGLLDGTAASHVQKLGKILEPFAANHSSIQSEVAIASD